MKLNNFSVLIIGLVIVILGWLNLFSKIGIVDGMTNGIITAFIGFPLVLIGLIIVINKVVKNKKSGMV